MKRMSLTHHGVLSINLSFTSAFLVGAAVVWKILDGLGVVFPPQHILLGCMVLFLLGLLIPPYVCIPGLIKGTRHWKEKGGRFCVLMSTLGLMIYVGTILGCILYTVV